ncbi:pyridoxal phosphate-dependent transferase [Amylocarpus encephaloides]|uniref:Pyridoxal phosphate-dependent transferase n=1 Tax=Amylocarpus encephaloides TaxID=45428 RepID=A0A9P7Y7L4_9HELO|nr:pyridoxal phosphate-dependent transferase [Amylocarpus encephaloides]
MKNVHHISDCNPYRQRLNGESNEKFVARKAAELDAKFLELGPNTVIGFICEPVVGAAMGCVPFVPGYLKAMQDVCHKHGALFILDEVMCGMEGVLPDIQTIAKGLGGGYQAISAVLVSPKVVQKFDDKDSNFLHGQTYQGMPISAVAALTVLKQGALLKKGLQAALGNHPNVGDIRGMGLFVPFDQKLGVAKEIIALAFRSYNLLIYGGVGSANSVHGDHFMLNSVQGDHIMIMPAYIIRKKDTEFIIKMISKVVHKYFDNIKNIP